LSEIAFAECDQRSAAEAGCFIADGQTDEACSRAFGISGGHSLQSRPSDRCLGSGFPLQATGETGEEFVGMAHIDIRSSIWINLRWYINLLN
jgi:hypothetical protein